MQEIRDDITKKALYEFKKFARKERFWQEYKKCSVPINRRKMTFIDVLNIYEPMELIQSSEVFCMWNGLYPRESRTRKSWLQLSKEWLIVCSEKKIFRNEENFLSYYKTIMRY